MSAQTQTHTPERQAARSIFPATVALSPAGYHRRIEAARRRATDARHKADRRPTPENLDRAAELEAGLHRMETEARA